MRCSAGVPPPSLLLRRRLMSFYITEPVDLVTWWSADATKRSKRPSRSNRASLGASLTGPPPLQACAGTVHGHRSLYDSSKEACAKRSVGRRQSPARSSPDVPRLTRAARCLCGCHLGGAASYNALKRGRTVHKDDECAGPYGFVKVVVAEPQLARRGSQQHCQGHACPAAAVARPAQHPKRRRHDSVQVTRIQWIFFIAYRMARPRRVGGGQQSAVQHLCKANARAHTRSGRTAKSELLVATYCRWRGR